MTTGNGNQTQAAPQLNVLAQYVKDLSFENPNAPRSLLPQSEQPSINIQVNVGAKPVNEGEFEVDLKIEGDAKVGDFVLFRFELNYGGVFRLSNIPQEFLHAAVMIECPRLLFPFARQIIAYSTRDGGFPPLYLEPVDFAALYQQQASVAQAGAPAPQMQ
jgi:preprotein translocase subunit SecB